MSNMSRRDFLMTAAATAAVISLPVLQGYADDAPPSIPAKPAGKPVNIGALSSFDKDGITDKWAKSDKFFVIRQDAKLYAVTSICTHRGFQLISRGQDLYCTKHKSDFSIEGTVTGGPAKSSLPRYAISLNDKKEVLVDKSKSFKEVQWSTAGSFIGSFIDLKSA
jgi:nitrite reductase/ring-hydroxylating ferredoxin subunit